MGIGDKADAKKDQIVGGAKEKIGDATDNHSLQAEGAAQKSEGGLKGAWEKAKDAVEDAVDNVKDRFDGDDNNKR